METWANGGLNNLTWKTLQLEIVFFNIHIEFIESINVNCY